MGIEPTMIGFADRRLNLLATRGRIVILDPVELTFPGWQRGVRDVRSSGPLQINAGGEIRTLRTGILSAGCLPVASRQHKCG